MSKTRRKPPTRALTQRVFDKFFVATLENMNRLGFKVDPHGLDFAARMLASMMYAKHEGDAAAAAEDFRQTVAPFLAEQIARMGAESATSEFTPPAPDAETIKRLHDGTFLEGAPASASKYFHVQPAPPISDVIKESRPKIVIPPNAKTH